MSDRISFYNENFPGALELLSRLDPSLVSSDTIAKLDIILGSDAPVTARLLHYMKRMLPQLPLELVCEVALLAGSLTASERLLTRMLEANAELKEAYATKLQGMGALVSVMMSRGVEPGTTRYVVAGDELRKLYEENPSSTLGVANHRIDGDIEARIGSMEEMTEWEQLRTQEELRKQLMNESGATSMTEH